MAKDDAIHRPGEKVPQSGVYDVVDEDGAELGSQKVCHAGNPFPPTVREGAHGYVLSFAAEHLDRGGPGAGSIFHPHDLAPVSGVYDVVDEDGNPVDPPHQKVAVEGRIFPKIRDKNPKAKGYLLAYEARHLHPGSERYRPGHSVEASGVYDLVGEDGTFLGEQKALVEGERFPPIAEAYPEAYGYQLHQEAAHLRN